jgi:tRNA nucleotidyltransferase (CCA-adding enzyme)
MNDIAKSLIFPDSIENLFSKLFEEGFYITLVGGAVRDFLLTKELSKDLDFELRHIQIIKDAEWVEKIIQLKEKLSKEHNLDVQSLPYSILRISIGEFSVELSSPRLEVFSGEEGKGHSDFDVTYFSQLDYEKSFARRDFTINAMGLEITKNTRQFIDPFAGLNDLRNKELMHCGDNFFEDPVRFARLVRFSIKLGFSIKKDLEMKLCKFNLQKLSNYYFFNESEKVGILKFAKLFFKLKYNFNIKLADKIERLSFLSAISSNKVLLNKEELLKVLILETNCSEDDIKAYYEFASLKIKKVKALYKLRDAQK